MVSLPTQVIAFKFLETGVPLSSVQIPHDSVSVREGERLVWIEHCAGCHGVNFTGRVYRKLDYVAQLAGPNITTIISDYTDEDVYTLCFSQ